MPRTSQRRIPRWAWPACMTALAIGALALSWMLHPAGEDGVSFLGRPLDQPCSVLLETGRPCPNCGFTRSLMWAGRGRLWRATQYHPAGATLLVWMVVGGVIGSRRLLGRDPRAWKVPWQVLVGGVLLWMVGLYSGAWVARLLF